MTLYELLARRYLHGIVFLEFNSMNFSFVLKNKRFKNVGKIKGKNASPILGSIFFLGLTPTLYPLFFKTELKFIELNFKKTIP